MASSESVLGGVGFVLQTWVWWLRLGCRCDFGGLVLCCRHGFGGWGWVAGLELSFSHSHKHEQRHCGYAFEFPWPYGLKICG
uniref:Uncharacterized protein n=1 Tax=Fagus sylvatica TaxID=28930 RepID=A0A2N9IZA8_FAGSY